MSNRLKAALCTLGCIACVVGAGTVTWTLGISQYERNFVLGSAITLIWMALYTLWRKP